MVNKVKQTIRPIVNIILASLVMFFAGCPQPAPPPGWSYIFSVTPSPDSSKVAFIGSCVPNKLYGSFITSNAQLTTIDSTMFIFSTMLQITPDSAMVVYTNTKGILSVSPILASNPVFIDYAQSFQIAPDGKMVVYLKNVSASTASLYVNSLPQPGIAVQIDMDVNTFLLTQDSQSVVYTKGSSDNLYSSLLTASLPVSIDTGVNNFTVTSDSKEVVYTNTSNDLFSSPITASVPVQIDSSIVSFQVTQDGQRIVYTKGSSGDLYSSPITTSSPVLIDTGVDGFTVTADSGSIIYTKSSALTSQCGSMIWNVIPLNDLYSSPVTTSVPVLIDRGITNFIVTQDSKKIVYAKPCGSTLYSSPLTAGIPVQIDSGVMTFQVTPDSNYVVYTKVSSNDLYSSTIAMGTPVLIDTKVSDFTMTPDSKYILYIKPHAYGSGLYSSPLTVGSPVTIDENPPCPRPN